MRNQTKYDIPLRPLNAEEKAILKEVQDKTGMKFKDIGVEYERHTPRATICTVFRSKYWGLLFGHSSGVAIRSKTDAENPEVGRLIAFRRALEDSIEWQKREENNGKSKILKSGEDKHGTKSYQGWDI